MKTPSLSLIALGVLLACRSAAAGDFDGPPDTETKGGAEVASWEPCITAFYVAKKSKENVSAPADSDYKPVDAPPGAQQGWAVLKDAVRIHKPGSGYEGSDLVYSGWRLQTSGDQAGLGFEAEIARPNDATISTHAKNQPVSIFYRLDIFMSLDDARKKELVEKHFRLVDARMSFHAVSDDRSAFRGGAQAAILDTLPLFHVDGREQKNLPKWKIPGAEPLERLEWTPRAKGVYEIHYSVTLSGRLDEKERAEEKTVEGAIRVAVSDEQFDIGNRHFEGTR